VGVGVEEPVLQDLNEVGLRGPAGHQVDGDAPGFEARLVGDLDACVVVRGWLGVVGGVVVSCWWVWGLGMVAIRGLYPRARSCMDLKLQLLNSTQRPQKSNLNPPPLTRPKTPSQQQSRSESRSKGRPPPLQAPRTGQVLERQHAARAELPVHDRRAHPVHVAEVAPELVGVAALFDVIDLLVEDLGALLVDALVGLGVGVGSRVEGGVAGW